MLPGAINFHRSGLNVNLNDESGNTLNGSGNLSMSGGSVSISGGNVAINATSKLLVQKSKSSYISLENEFYAKSSMVYENGSDRQSNSPFTDDEPTAGVAEVLAKQKEEQEKLEFNNEELAKASEGSEACVSNVTGDSDDNSSNDDTSKEGGDNNSFFNSLKNNLISDWKATDAGLTDFSESCQEGMDWIGEKLGIDYDRPQSGSGKTLREIAEERKEENYEYTNKLREEAPNKKEFDIVRGTINLGLNIISLLNVGYDAINLSRLGVNIAKEIPVCQKVVGNASNIIDDLSNFTKNLFNDAKAENEDIITENSGNIENSSGDTENTSSNIENTSGNTENTSENLENTSKNTGNPYRNIENTSENTKNAGSNEINNSEVNNESTVVEQPPEPEMPPKTEAVGNANRLSSYINEDGKISDIELYNQAKEHCVSYEELKRGINGKPGKSDLQIIESAMKGNEGMDACCGLYDDYYSTYK